MPVVRGTYAELLAPGLNMHTFDRLREKPEIFSRFMKVMGSTRAYEEDAGHAGLGPLAEKRELELAMLDQPEKLSLVRFIHKTYGLAIVFSEEARDDDQYGFITQMAGMLGRSSRWTTELWGHDTLNLGFVTTRYTSRDGKALFASDHFINGKDATRGTFSNMPAVPTDLSVSALEEAIQLFGTMVDERGMPVESSARKLIVGPGNEMTARRILETTSYPGSNLNDINPIQASGLELIVTPFLSDPDSWYLLGDTNDVDMRFYWRMRPDTKTWDDEGRDATFHRIKQRHSVGVGDWFHTYGSQGA